MARQGNQLTSQRVTITTTPAVKLYLEQLVETGLYGKNPSEAAERLIAGGIEQALKDGTLDRQPRNA